MTRHPAVAASAAATIEELAPGRTMIGIGTGDSSVDNIGVRPAKHAELAAYVKTIRELLQSGESVYNGSPCKLTWFRGRIPIYIAASGPRTLQLAGEIADGVVINTGLTPDIVRDFIAQVKIGCAHAGRNIGDVDMWWLPLTNVGPARDKAVDEIAMTLASAGSHLSRFTVKGKHIPEHLMDKVKMLGTRYNLRPARQAGQQQPRADQGAGAASTISRSASRWPAHPRTASPSSKPPSAPGRVEFWMSIHFDDKERFMRDRARDIMPAFR